MKTTANPIIFSTLLFSSLARLGHNVDLFFLRKVVNPPLCSGTLGSVPAAIILMHNIGNPEVLRHFWKRLIDVRMIGWKWTFCWYRSNRSPRKVNFNIG